jgi:hypothetical protein
LREPRSKRAVLVETEHADDRRELFGQLLADGVDLSDEA